MNDKDRIKQLEHQKRILEDILTNMKMTLDEVLKYFDQYKELKKWGKLD